MGFLGTIFTILLVLWLLGRLLPYLLAWFLARQGRKIFNAAAGSPYGGQDGGRGNAPREKDKKEGEITVESADSETADATKISKTVGQYVDYEEQQ